MCLIFFFYLQVVFEGYWRGPEPGEVWNKGRLCLLLHCRHQGWGCIVAQLVEHQTVTAPTQVRFPGAARDFSPGVYFLCTRRKKSDFWCDSGTSLFCKHNCANWEQFLFFGISRNNCSAFWSRYRNIDLNVTITKQETEETHRRTNKQQESEETEEGNKAKNQHTLVILADKLMHMCGESNDWLNEQVELIDLIDKIENWHWIHLTSGLFFFFLSVIIVIIETKCYRYVFFFFSECISDVFLDSS